MEIGALKYVSHSLGEGKVKPGGNVTRASGGNAGYTNMSIKFKDYPTSGSLGARGGSECGLRKSVKCGFIERLACFYGKETQGRYDLVDLDLR